LNGFERGKKRSSKSGKKLFFCVWGRSKIGKRTKAKLNKNKKEEEKEEEKKKSRSSPETNKNDGLQDKQGPACLSPLGDQNVMQQPAARTKKNLEWGETDTTVARMPETGGKGRRREGVDINDKQEPIRCCV
jgi:hypothetical protein